MFKSYGFANRFVKNNLKIQGIWIWFWESTFPLFRLVFKIFISSWNCRFIKTIQELWKNDFRLNLGVSMSNTEVTTWLDSNKNFKFEKNLWEALSNSRSIYSTSMFVQVIYFQRNFCCFCAFFLKLHLNNGISVCDLHIQNKLF